MVLKLHECFPLFAWKDVVLVPKQKLHEETDRVRKDFWVETFEDFALVLVVVFPRCGLTFLRIKCGQNRSKTSIFISACTAKETYS